MKISYAITVCNELKEIKRLIGYLVEGKRREDEIVILFDSKNGTKEVEEALDVLNTIDWYKLHKSPFNNHFADWKNLLTSLCTGDYIYQIDADELINEDLLRPLFQFVNFPDYQWRIYKNNGKIKWKNKVHEVLEGYKTLTALPTEEIYCLIHEKTIKKQEKQNSYYDTL